MKLLRAIFSLVLAVVATVLVACGGPTQAKAPPTYTSEQIAALDRYASPINTARSRMSELEDLIQKEDWVFARNFIHGPLGQLRGSMSFVSRNLLPGEQKKAMEVADEVFKHLNNIDSAAQNRNYPLALQQYREAIKDFDAFLKFIPSQPAS